MFSGCWSSNSLNINTRNFQYKELTVVYKLKEYKESCLHQNIQNIQPPRFLMQTYGEIHWMWILKCIYWNEHQYICTSLFGIYLKQWMKWLRRGLVFILILMRTAMVSRSLWSCWLQFIQTDISRSWAGLASCKIVISTS